MSELTTAIAMEAVAWERAPRYPGRTVNRRIVCADGFKVSVQASRMHYANDSALATRNADGLSDNAPYWRSEDSDVVYPFTTFEVGNPDEEPKPKKVWKEYDGEGIWAWVPRHVVAALLDRHGGAVAWETPKDGTP